MWKRGSSVVQRLRNQGYCLLYPNSDSYLMHPSDWNALNAYFNNISVTLNTKNMKRELKQNVLNCMQFKMVDDEDRALNGQTIETKHDYCFGKTVFCYKNNEAFDQTFNNANNYNYNSCSLLEESISISKLLEQVGNNIIDHASEQTGINLSEYAVGAVRANKTGLHNDFFNNNSVNNLTVYHYQNACDFQQKYQKILQLNPVYNILTTLACTTHFDLDLLTLIYVNSGNDTAHASAGLQIACPQCQWIDIEKCNKNSNGMIIVMVGALLQYVSNNYFYAIPHRVARTLCQNSDRISIVCKMKSNENSIIKWYNHGFQNDSRKRETHLSGIKTSAPYFFDINRYFDDYCIAMSENGKQCDKITAKTFNDYLGGWYSESREKITKQYLLQQEIEIMKQTRFNKCMH